MLLYEAGATSTVVKSAGEGPFVDNLTSKVHGEATASTRYLYFKRWLPLRVICGETNQSLLVIALETILAD
ncbi:hypothetical protein FLJC2902T_31820 [Flavobacterium limnosediminis JC2902]|uniref:Uncharacterized protein n=1 Tax=Flavobacterium limnosediminis JC2902 TaxID=1341181 RepID=V6SEI2_9FLAO|nr:hypothetical protein FLJC2902T_31820 [Flavobacterium limnosediminis JC2902]